MRALLAFVILILSLVLPSMAADPLTDEALYDQVRIKIARDREVGGGKIEVKVTNGVVELTGTVKQDKLKERAEKLARKVKGVKSVENKLRVAPV
jgi:hyperosmotically inducible periplasmic protein